MFRIVYIYQDSEDDYIPRPELQSEVFDTEQDAKIFILESQIVGALMSEDRKLNEKKKVLTLKSKELQEYIEEELPRYSVIEINNTKTYEINDFSEEELKMAYEQAGQNVLDFRTREREYTNRILRGEKNIKF